MTTLVTDTFIRANESPIAAPWSNINADTADLDANTMVPTSANSDARYIYTFAAPNDQWARVRVNALNINSALCVFLRENSNNEWYQIVADFTADQIGIAKFNFGFTGIDAQPTPSPWAIGDTLEGGVVGDAFYAMRNGVLLASGNDSTFGSGSFGVRFAQGGGALCRIDLFEAGDFSSPTGNASASNIYSALLKGPR